jgi:hypothetical protein
MYRFMQRSMHRTTCVILFACFLSAFLPAADASAETLELRIVTTGGESAAAVSPGGASLPVIIQGKLSNPLSTGGLAGWYADIRNEGTLNIDLADTSAFVLEAPAGMAGFDRDDGYCNAPGPDPGPSGYGGTASGVQHILWQVGGAQNTMNNDAPPPYPVGSVVEDIANSGTWTDLAVGSVFVDGAIGDTVVLSISRAGASTLDGGPGVSGSYAVSSAATEVIGEPLSIRVAAILTSAHSVGYHAAYGSWAGGDIALPIALDTATGAAGLSEPRMFNVGGQYLSVLLTFDVAVSAAEVLATIAPSPAATVTMTQVDTHVVAMTWDSAPIIDLVGGNEPPQYSYRFELGGSAAGEFEIAYIESDVTCSGKVDGFDTMLIRNSANWLRDLSTAAIKKTDINRDGIVDGIEISRVSANFNKPATPLVTVTCP